MRRAVVVGLSAWICAAAAVGAPHRIVSMSPNVTEMLYGIGAFGELVGVSDYCTYPREAARLPSVGGWSNPSLEKLAGLNPDLVILDDAQAPFMEGEMKALGLRTMVVPDHTVEDVYAAIEALGRATGHEEGAAKLTRATHEGLDRVSKKTAGRPKPSVTLIVNRTPGTLHDLYVATEGSFLAELVAIAGGRIAAPKAAGGYAKLSKEDLLAMNPDIILDFVHGPSGRLAGDPIEAWRELPELKAVRGERVYGVQDDFVPHASQRIAATAQLFARLIHPEAR